LSRLAVLGDCSMLCSIKFEALLNGQTHVEISDFLLAAMADASISWRA